MKLTLLNVFIYYELKLILEASCQELNNKLDSDSNNVAQHFLKLYCYGMKHYECEHHHFYLITYGTFTFLHILFFTQ